MGGVYVSDSADGAVYRLSASDNTLHKIAQQHAFPAANGLAIFPYEKTLYVSTWRNGLDIVDLESGTVESIRNPKNVCLAFIDGLYATQQNSIAIQNVPMQSRIVRFSD